MSRSLRYLGMLALATAAWLAIAESAGWVAPAIADGWLRLAVRAGVVLLALGVLGTLVAPVGRALRRGRCVRCGVSIERGQTYCLDHLRRTVDEYNDRSRDQFVHRSSR